MLRSYHQSGSEAITRVTIEDSHGIGRKTHKASHADGAMCCRPRYLLSCLKTYATVEV